MKFFIHTLLATVFSFTFSAKSQSGEIIRKTYFDAAGNPVTGYVYQSANTWRYARTNRYPLFLSSGFFFPAFPHCSVAPAPRHTSFASPAIRHSLPTARIAPRPAPAIRPSGSLGVRPSPAPPPHFHHSANSPTHPHLGNLRPPRASRPPFPIQGSSTTLRVFQRR